MKNILVKIYLVLNFVHFVTILRYGNITKTASIHRYG